MRELHGTGQVSPSCGRPFGWRGTPPERHHKGKICNHESKAKWYFNLGEKKYWERRQDTVAPKVQK